MAGVLETLKVVYGGRTRSSGIETYMGFMNIVIHCRRFDDQVTWSMNKFFCTNECLLATECDSSIGFNIVTGKHFLG
jgi:hypothetical protein